MGHVSKLLNSYGPSERRDLLKRYLLMCVRDNVISFSEIARAPDKVMRTITSDSKAVVVELGRASANGLLEMAMDVVAGRRK
jgi:hypothetical protein